MTAKGFDCDTHLTAAIIQAAKAAGHIAAGRYLKNLTAAEVALCRQYDFGLWLIAEGMGDRATLRRGRAGGISDAAVQVRQALALGVPGAVPIASAVDFDAVADDLPLVDAYMDGFASLISPHPLVVYGDGAVLTSHLPAGTRAYVAGAGGWEGTQAYLAQTKMPALVQHPTAAMFGISVDPVDINDESVIWYPARDDAATATGGRQQETPVQTSMPPLKSLQRTLIALGYQIDADGVWGRQTEGALSDYYSQNPG